MDQEQLDNALMTRAVELASRGRGSVEPNPMVGCLITRGAEIISQGWHRRFGGPHAEIEALNLCGSRASGATMYVTLEPCCHHGKTPPCSQAVIRSGVRRVVIAHRDPFPQVAGGGVAELQAAGISVTVGPGAADAEALNAPYLKRLQTGLPWVIAKWAMTLDGKLATCTGDSQWISNAASRAVVHELRGRMDAILIGRGTAAADDPQLTARPLGPRMATRIVLDRQASLSLDSKLVQTAGDVPVLVVAGPDAPAASVESLQAVGVEVFSLAEEDRQSQLPSLLEELGRRQMTNLLVEGGGQVLGSFLDAGLIDEVHVFIAAKLAGGVGAATPIAGRGIAQMAEALSIPCPEISVLEGDVYVRGRIAW